MATTDSVPTTYLTEIIRRRKIAATTKILGGTLTALDANKYLVPGADTTGYLFAGISIAEVDNGAGANGDLGVDCYQTGLHELPLQEGNATQADIGTKVYIYDNIQVARIATVTNNVEVGTIVDIISASYVLVRINVFGS